MFRGGCACADARRDRPRAQWPPLHDRDCTPKTHNGDLPFVYHEYHNAVIQQATIRSPCEAHKLRSLCSDHACETSTTSPARSSLTVIRMAL